MQNKFIIDSVWYNKPKRNVKCSFVFMCPSDKTYANLTYFKLCLSKYNGLSELFRLHNTINIVIKNCAAL